MPDNYLSITADALSEQQYQALLMFIDECGGENEALRRITDDILLRNAQRKVETQIISPAQKIKLTILRDSGRVDKDVIPTSEEIESLFLELSEDDAYGVISDFRNGMCGTNIEPEFSRHYDTESVAAKMFDGSWVGWTFVSGGGKHGDPDDAYDWIGNSYDLSVVSEIERVIVEREFARV